MNDAATKTVVIVPAQPTAEETLGKEISAFEAQAASFVIASDVDYAEASEIIKRAKAMQKSIEEYWEPLRVSAKKAYDDVLSHKKTMLDPMKRVESILKGKMADYLTEQERQRKAREEELKKLALAEADKKLAESIAASEAGDDEAAEYAMAEAEVLEAAAVNSVIPKQSVKASGVSVSKAWKITSIDNSKVPIELNGFELRPVDEAAVMRLIKASKGAISIPGVKYEETATISIRA